MSQLPHPFFSRPPRRLILRAGALVGLTACTTPPTRSPVPGQVTPQPSPPAGVPASPSATAGVATAASTATGVPSVAALSCIVTPALTEGPYFVDERLNRSDIRPDPSDNTVSAGTPLTINLQVVRVTGNACAPIANAAVDVWQCNALGVYSDVSDPSGSTRGKKFLRGYQTTDANGAVRFTTIYPGWYSGRAVHIHFKVRIDMNSRSGQEVTSQWFFDDALSDQVFQQAPYATRPNRNVRNTGDSIYRQSGSQLLLPLTVDGNGYTASYTIGLRA